MAAPVPIPFQTYYSASKAAINSYTMALANELRPFGITVCAVMPGDIHTGFTACLLYTSIAGIRKLESMSFRSAAMEAVIAAWEREREMQQQK